VWRDSIISHATELGATKRASCWKYSLGGLFLKFYFKKLKKFYSTPLDEKLNGMAQKAKEFRWMAHMCERNF
jgi:hypothetical protein